MALRFPDSRIFTVRLKQLIQQKSSHWFGNRMPVADEIRLSQRSTYIWPTRAGYLVMAVTILMMVGATNYQNNLAFLLTFLLVGIGLVSIVFTFKNLQGICFTCLPVAEAFAGQPVSITLNLRSLTGKSHSSIGVGLTQKDLLLCDVPADQSATLVLELEAGERGFWQLPRLRVSSQFPFGWLRTWAYFRFKTPVLVYPEALEPPQRYHQRDSGEVNETGSKTSGNEDLYGLKPYQQGEPLARVDWKSFARERGMYIREFADYQSHQLCFSWQDFPGCDAENRLSYLTHMVIEAASHNLSYSLELPDQLIPQADGEKHRRECLRALALFAKDDKKTGAKSGTE